MESTARMGGGREIQTTRAAEENERPSTKQSTLSDEALRAMGGGCCPGYWEPYSGRRLLTRGEIGCFLSHHHVWEQVVSRGLSSVLLFEDDCRFEQNFRRRLELTMAEVSAQGLQWDLIYVGRKRMQVERPEAAVPGVRALVVPDYSYWTLSYALSLRGAQKLLLAQPLSRMVPVDEFLPVMYDKHPTYCAPFSPRDLLAFSLEPLLVFPSHYAGQALYVSDTEASALWGDGGDGDQAGSLGSLGSLAGGGPGAKGARGARGSGVVGVAASRDEL
ncbi:LOW QUALITY PROTEIN: procollagen galactosyltransferase 1-like [Lampetra planeri]